MADPHISRYTIKEKNGTDNMVADHLSWIVKDEEYGGINENSLDKHFFAAQSKLPCMLTS